MKSAYKFYTVCFFLLSDIMVFAQVPTEDEDGDLQEEDAPAMILTRWILWLAIAGIIFAFYHFRRGIKEALPEKNKSVRRSIMQDPVAKNPANGVVTRNERKYSIKVSESLGVI